MNPKLSPTVSVIRNSSSMLEFFLSGIRQQVHIKVENDLIERIVCSLDGTRTVEQLCSEYETSAEDMNNLLNFLRSKGVLDNSLPHEDFYEYERFRRVIHFLAEYSSSHEHLLSMWKNINSSTVLVIGLGAVGTWTACNLAQSGVCNIILMDDDVVDITNLHRQFGFTQADTGRFKTDVIAERLLKYNPDINVTASKTQLQEGSLEIFNDVNIDLIINCADQPTVDMTSLLTGQYAMSRAIPHIIGGGYNLHLSLIGQTVIPGKSACVKCFEKTLDELNKIDPDKVKKLMVKNRKIGSFGPMCSLIASMISMEAIKVLSREIQPSNVNRRGEFDIYTMDITYKEFPRRDDCEWCSKQGLYYQNFTEKK